MDDKNKVSADTAFEQLFIEMRRYRDLEHRIVTWWTTILLAIMAAFVGFGGDRVQLSWVVKGFGIVFVVALGFVMWRLVKHSNVRYRQLRAKSEKPPYCERAFRLPCAPRLRETTWFRHIPVLGQIPQLGRIRLSGFFFMTLAMFIITAGFCAFLLWIPAKGATQMNAVSWMTAVQTIALVATAIILGFTLCRVVQYAKAARRQAEILADQFDVRYRPHLRPVIRHPQDNLICICLMNLSGVEAIEPGVYPGWKPEKRNGVLKPMSSLPCSGVNEPDDDFATCDVLAVGCEVGWWVRKPKQGEPKEVKIRWGQHPWEERLEDVWTLVPNPNKPSELHFQPPCYVTRRRYA